MSEDGSQTSSGVPTSNAGASSSKNTPNMDPVLVLQQKLLYYEKKHENTPKQECTEVMQSIYIGEPRIAYNLDMLRQLNVGYVLSVTDIQQSTGNPTSAIKEYYIASNIRFIAILGDGSSPIFFLDKHFEVAAEFIQIAILFKANVLLLCSDSDTYSASLLVAFLMLYSGVTLMKALDTICTRKTISLNVNILCQLINLYEKLNKNQPILCLSSGKCPCESAPRCIILHELMCMILFQHVQMIPSATLNEVHKDIFLSDAIIGENLEFLQSVGLSWILNANHEPSLIPRERYLSYNINVLELSGQQYDDMNGLQHFFIPAAMFIDSCIRSKFKIVIYCRYGIGRSACLVAAYLMLYKNYTVQAAIEQIGKMRAIMPNRYFLRQLRDLSNSLQTPE